MFALFLFAQHISSSLNVSPALEKGFVQFLRQHNLIYTGSEYQLRLGIFATNSRAIREFNARGESYQVGLTKFAVYTPAELSAMLSLKPHPILPTKSLPKVAAPDAIDWREYGVVTPVKESMHAGVTAAIATEESIWAVAKGDLLTLSEQNILICMGEEEFGPQVIYDYVINFQNNGFTTAEKWHSSCDLSPEEIAAYIYGYVVIDGTEDDLKEKVGTLGPAAVETDASRWGFQLYTGGIYDDQACSSTVLNHCMVCVGYGTASDIDYWIVKNSWGSSWGEMGYIRMVRNKNNQCGIATAAVIPVVTQ